MTREFIEIDGGLIGISTVHCCLLLQRGAPGWLRWLQSVDDASAAFPVIDPWRLFPDYAPHFPEADVAALGLSESSPGLVLAILTVPSADVHHATANLAGPIVINPRLRRARQVILTNEEYHAKHRIIGEDAAAA